MTTSFVLRIVPGVPGDLAGEVEAVLSGERTVIRSGDDLLSYLRTALEGDRPDVASVEEHGGADGH